MKGTEDGNCVAFFALFHLVEMPEMQRDIRRLPVVVALLAVVSCSLIAQQSRGMLPSYFRLPSANDDVHFTSPQKPDVPTPVYPEAHRLNQVEGAVEVQLFVTSEGEVVRADVAVSSGDVQFDDAALRSAMKARFPVGYATVDGRPVDFKIDVPFYFMLSPDPELYWHTRLELARIQAAYEIQMKEFQGFLAERTKTSPSRIESSQRRIEQSVASAKRLHRMLAEKKESAILRLREEIAITKQHMEDPQGTTRAVASDMTWRNVRPEQVMPTVAMPVNLKGVITQNALSNNDLERLQSELELKKSYL
jgi:TonB family protein